MYIEPNTRIIFLRNCPLDENYENTYLFSNQTEQYNYFYSLKKFELNKQTYNRVSRGVSRVQIKAEDLYDCNYMMFQNTSFGDKWFYAFITGVDYVSNIVSEVSFKIDEIQTWFESITLKDSFILRQHTLTDNIGDNIVEETLETGDYVIGELKRFDCFDEWICVVASTTFLDGSRGSSVHIYNDIWSGCYYLVFQTVDELQTYINMLLNQDYAESSIDDIQSIYMYPKAFISTTDNTIPKTLVKINQDVLAYTSVINGYTPKNNKLYTYPYNYMQITDFGNNTKNYRYEFFNGFRTGNTDYVTFEVTGEGSPNTEFMCTPIDYGDVEGNNYAMACRTSGFPMCSFNSDAFDRWLALNKTSIETDIMKGDITGFMQGAMQGGIGVGSISPQLAPIGAVAGGIYTANMNYFNTVLSALSTSNRMKKTGDTVTGKQGSGLNIALKIQGFTAIQKYITKEYAMIIDNFFTMYGYAINKVDTPNVNARPYYTYIRTNGCNLVGTCPSDSIARIKGIFDSGITFWKSGTTIGDYSVDNSPLDIT